MIRATVSSLCVYFFVYLYGQNPILTFENDFNPNYNGKKYTFQNIKGKFASINTSKGAKKIYVFNSNQGFSVDPSDILSDVYTIEMVLQLSEVESYARILDFKGLSTDVGVYARHSTVVYYQVANSNVRILRPNDWFHLTLTRTSNNAFSAYINGILAYQFKDNNNLTRITRPLIFFDDDGTESHAGKLGALNFFDVCLSSDAIAERAKTYLAEFGQKKTETKTTSNQDYYEYRFEGNFDPENGKGTVLKPIGKGRFEVQDIAPCGKKGVYHFGENCGFTFENKGFIGAEHTIELYFKFDNLKSWKRIVDYKNRTSDTGPYAFDNQIEFYKIAISKNFPFRENRYAHVVLVREANENYSLYVDGVLRAMFKDINELGIPSNEDVLHFFRDDLQVPNECSSGTVAFLRIYNYAVNSQQIAENAKKMPCPTNNVMVSNDKPKETEKPKEIIVEKPKEIEKPKEVIIEKPKEITYKLTLKIIDETTQKEITARISVKNKEKNQSVIDTTSTGINKNVSEGVYQVIVDNNNYLPAQEEIVIMKGNASKVIALKKIEVGTTVTLENIYFEPNSDKIAVESYQNLMNFANYLKNKPSLKVRINGHTDAGVQGTGKDYLLDLSAKRAKSVVDFLVKNGVNASQLESKGYGSSKPIASNETPEGRAKNRRVEFEVLEK